jgi:hypothetical protein
MAAGAAVAAAVAVDMAAEAAPVTDKTGSLFFMELVSRPRLT